MTALSTVSVQEAIAMHKQHAAAARARGRKALRQAYACTCCCGVLGSAGLGFTLGRLDSTTIVTGITTAVNLCVLVSTGLLFRKLHREHSETTFSEVKS